MRPRISAPSSLGSRPGATDFISRRIIPRFCRSERTAAATPGYCTLTATSLALVARAVDLADRGGGDRHGSKDSKTSSSVSPYSCSRTFFMSLKRDLRRGVAQLGQLGLELLAELLGHQADVEERHDLAELHRRALHRPQRGDDLLGRLDLAAGHRVLRGLLVARQVRRAGGGLLGALGRGQAADLGRARPARRGNAILAGHRSGGALHLAAGDDVVASVGPADPRLVAAVVVVAEQDQRRGLAERGARLGALGVQAAPDADERVAARTPRRRWTGRCGRGAGRSRAAGP